MTGVAITLSVAIAASVAGLLSLALLVHQWAKRASEAEVEAAQERSAREIAAEALAHSEAAREDEADRFRRAVDDLEREIEDLESRVVFGPAGDVLRARLETARRAANGVRRLAIVPGLATAGGGRGGADADSSPSRGAVPGAVGDVPEPK